MDDTVRPVAPADPARNFGRARAGRAQRCLWCSPRGRGPSPRSDRDPADADDRRSPGSVASRSSATIVTARRVHHACDDTRAMSLISCFFVSSRSAACRWSCGMANRTSFDTVTFNAMYARSMSVTTMSLK